ncbi:adhesion G protein-coupled receptor L3-like [Ostrea edulis]|uniref:adhesion G protein-coupled receptor L3-like n=1 Tax=Ostrea edulis TaxID=37623 RepID=UPI0024AF9B36|nr:adhesion G protein-coupled receptor L3-like [Ostrea edulis]
MRIKLYVFQLFLQYITTVYPCKTSQKIILQPYSGTAIAYPENYPTGTGYGINLNCSWEITSGEGYHVVMYPTRISCGSETTLKLYYGSTMLAETADCLKCPDKAGYCSDIVQTKSSDVRLVLSTSSSLDNGGFQFYFMAVETNRAKVCNSNGTKLMATRSPNFITSPEFPAKYPNFLDCSWIVERAVTESESLLVFQFRSQYLESSIESCNDYVKIDGLGEFCKGGDEYILQTSRNMPVNVTSVNVRFKSDEGYAESGFVLAYYIEDPLRPCSCQHGGTCSNSTCICSKGYKGPNCENESLKMLSFSSSSSDVREGKSVWFRSEIVDNFDFRVRWFRKGILITSASTRYTMTSSPSFNGTELHMLNISRALQRDIGNWTVKASNGVTTVSANFSLVVRPGLLLQMMPQFDFSIRSGEEINLQCSVTNAESLKGLTNGRLIWQKDGKAIVLDSAFNVSTLETTTTLRKLSAVLDDSGRYSCSHSGYPDPVYESVNIKVTEKEQKVCRNETSEDIMWNMATAGTTKKEACPKNQKGTATRYCDTQGDWEVPNLVNCTDEAFVNASKELDSLIADGVDNTEKLQETVNNTLQTMKNLTSKAGGLSSGDISSSLDILEKIVNVTNMTNGKIEKKAFFKVVDNVLSTNNSKSWATVSEKTAKGASSLLKSMDRLSEIVIRSNDVTRTNFSGDNFEVTINKTKIDEEGIIFPDVSSNGVSRDTKKFVTFLELPKQTGNRRKGINYVAVIYKTISDIYPKDSKSERSVNSNEVEEAPEKEEYVNSEILSLTTQTNLGTLSPPLNLTFNHIRKNNDTDLQPNCVSWNFTTNNWSEKGCKVSLSSTTRTVCQCIHLTNFAILMRPYVSEKEDSASLKTLSATGVILSIVFTVLTFIIYITNWKYIKSDLNIMLLNLCGSLVVSYLIFIVAVEKTNNEIVCTVITAVIHYLFLVTFFCMLGMGIYYFMSITVTYYAMYVANNFKSKSRVHWFLIGGWGIPFVIAASTLGGFWGKGYHLKNYCWLSMESGSLYLFIVPVCLIAVLNLIIIVTLIRVLFASSAMTKSSVQKKAASGLRSLGTLLPVLGVNWLFGMLAVNESAEFFQFLFIISNSLQGFFIFVSHVLMNKKLMDSMKSRYPVLAVLTLSTESSKKDPTSVSRTQSSGSDVPLKGPEKKKRSSKFGKFSQKTAKTENVQKSDSFLTENTDLTCRKSNQGRRSQMSY